MQKTVSFKKKIIATAIASIAAGMSGVVFAQDSSEPIDEVVITGIKASLTRAMDIKRESSGVVEGISSEDIGKMPDTNLAESLQRITGVSIDRSNGEGSKVTIRGFGADYNLVTLNGRVMPAANVQATSASNQRSYDFANLAADSISGVEVYKSGQAKLNTGGMGGLINIKTARPFDKPGLQMAVTAKAAMDTSNRSDSKGSDITPDISAFVSDTFADDKFGIGLTLSRSERDSGSSFAGAPNGWFSIRDSETPGGDWGTLPANGVTNRPGATALYQEPRNIIYQFQDVQRTRTNGQLTLQFKPVETVVATLDYTYAKLDSETQQHDMGAWFNGNPMAGSEYTTGPVSGPIIYRDSSTDDITQGVGDWGIINENKSLGLNVKWDVTDNLQLSVDYHDSTAEAGAKDSRGTNNLISTVTHNRASTTVDYSKEFPVATFTFNGLGPLAAANYQAGGTSFRNSFNEDKVKQAQIDGVYKFDESIVKSINFGLGEMENTYRTAYALSERPLWGGYGTTAQLPDSIYTVKSLSKEFSSLDGHDNPNLQPVYLRADFKGARDAVAAIATAAGETVGPCGVTLCVDDKWIDDRSTVETQDEAYIQANFATDLGTMPTHFDVGVRYSQTDVESVALAPTYAAVLWVSANEFTNVTSGQDHLSGKGSYDKWLPNVDFDIEVIEDLKLRASYSNTISRPGYDSIQAGASLGGVRNEGGTAVGGGSSGNPALLPFDSKNFDLSAEWYYTDASYVSLGYYKKKVKDFLASGFINTDIQGLRSAIGGDRWKAGVAATGTTDNQAVRDWIIANGGGTVTVGGVTGVGAAATDPLVQFKLSAQTNQKEAEVHGLEFNVQHVFGESGFGGIINYTTAKSDVEYDDANTNRVTGVTPQFVIVGVSDSANLVAFYEKYGFHARIAYNWRDKFLASLADGSGANPQYVRDYGQIDVNVSYDINDNFTLLAEMVNLTNESTRLHSRTENAVEGIYQLGPRYNLGARYKF